MKRREFITLLGGAAAAWPLAARAQQPERMRRIGVLMGYRANDSLGQTFAAVLVQGLGALDWREGSNLRIDWRSSGGDDKLYERYAVELVADGPDVLVAQSSPSVEALRRQTSTIPIVFVIVTDPVGQGLVASLAHPSGNVTGFSDFDPPIVGKWLQMLTEITPRVATVAVLYNPDSTPFAGLILRAIEAAAPSYSVTVRAAPCRDDAEIEAMMTGLAREERGGVLAMPEIFTAVHRDAIVTAAARHRLPAVYPNLLSAAKDELMSYGIDRLDLFRRTAAYVDRILKGERPADLPVQNPTKFELTINLKTAKALGVTIAPSLLATADEVIE
jgi:putative ABC transport system substrate-binding protein